MCPPAELTCGVSGEFQGRGSQRASMGVDAAFTLWTGSGIVFHAHSATDEPRDCDRVS